MRADDLMENDDLGPGGDLGELPPPVGQHALIDQNGNNTKFDQFGTGNQAFTTHLYGSDNLITVKQTDTMNVAYITQGGTGNIATVTQSGMTQTATVQQLGTDNKATVLQQ